MKYILTMIYRKAFYTMFSTNHFIWLGLCALFIGGLLYFSIRFKFSFKTATYIVSGIAIASELCKIFTHIESIYDESGKLYGGVLEAGALPFHLCSILIFFIIYLNFCKNDARLEKIKSFVIPIALLGGTMALLIPTSGVDFLQPYAYQCFVYHAGLIWYGLYLLISKQAALGLKSYRNNMVYLFSIMFVMLWVNSALQIYETNFFFLVRPPMENLPVLNLNNGWFVYFISLISVAFVLFTLLHIPFIISEHRRNKQNDETTNS